MFIKSIHLYWKHRIFELSIVFLSINQGSARERYCFQLIQVPVCIKCVRPDTRQIRPRRFQSRTHRKSFERKSQLKLQRGNLENSLKRCFPFDFHD